MWTFFNPLLTCGGGPEFGRPSHDVRALHWAVPRRALIHWSGKPPQGGGSERAVQVRCERCRQRAVWTSGDGAGKNRSWSLCKESRSWTHQVFCTRGYFNVGMKNYRDLKDFTFIKTLVCESTWCVRWRFPFTPTWQRFGPPIGCYGLMVSHKSLRQVSQQSQTLFTYSVPVMRMST